MLLYASFDYGLTMNLRYLPMWEVLEQNELAYYSSISIMHEDASLKWVAMAKDYTLKQRQVKDDFAKAVFETEEEAEIFVEIEQKNIKKGDIFFAYVGYDYRQ